MKSLCHTCKFGQCVKQIQREVVGIEPAEFEEQEDGNEFNLLGLEEESEKTAVGHVHEVERHMEFTLCYWAAREVYENQRPVEVHQVQECNRYVEEQAQ